MRRRLRLVAEGTQSAVSAGGVLFVLAGLTPLLWKHDGWLGAWHRTRSLLPLAVGFAVFGPISSRWRIYRARRRTKRQRAITQPRASHD